MTSDALDGAAGRTVNMAHAVISLMDGKYEYSLPDGRNDFGNDDEAAKRYGCLLFDTVTNGRSPTSESKFLSMPSEILAAIVDILSNDNKSNLASLALVNSDCRQLARSGQFADIHFDYSPAARDLAAHFRSEVSIQKGNKAENSPVSGIGSFVRRLIFYSDPNQVAACYQNLWFSIMGGAEDDQITMMKSQLEQEASDEYSSLQRSVLEAISTAMPNLEVLSWSDDIGIDDTFFEQISRSSAKHITLDRLSVNMPLTIQPPLTPPTWPLLSLDLDLERDVERTGTPGRAFYESILRRCAPTLESLKLRGIDSSMAFSHGANPFAFPRLRHLRLRVVDPQPSFVSLFTSSPLKTLELPSEDRNDKMGFHATGEVFRNLEALVVPLVPTTQLLVSELAQYLEQHRQVGKLNIREGQHAKGSRAYLDSHILPVLAQGGFGNLTSLALHWAGTLKDLGGAIDEPNLHIVDVPECSLVAIATIKSLTQLSLSAGTPVGWRCQWLIDHNTVRSHLRPLQHLKLLAFVRDTYTTSGYFDIDSEDYYVRRRLVEGDEATANSRPDLDIDGLKLDLAGATMEEFKPEVVLWERAHRNRMAQHAEAYAAVFPALERIICGQRPMGIEKGPEASKEARKVVSLTKYRDNCHSYLQATFDLGIWK